jgi:hypothetical protein
VASDSAAERSSLAASQTAQRDEALKVLLQNLLDSLLIAFMWGFGRCWSVRVD